MNALSDSTAARRSYWPSPPRLRRGLHDPRPDAVPTLVARACAFVGLLDVLAGVFTRFRHSRIHMIAEVLPGTLGPFAAALSLSAGILLLLLAHGLRRRKRRAWRAAVVLLPIGATAQITYRHSIFGVLISLALLWRWRWPRAVRRSTSGRRRAQPSHARLTFEVGQLHRQVPFHGVVRRAPTSYGQNLLAPHVLQHESERGIHGRPARSSPKAPEM